FLQNQPSMAEPEKTKKQENSSHTPKTIFTSHSTMISAIPCFFVFLLSSTLLLSMAAPPPQSPIPSCTNELVSLSPCLPYISSPPNNMSDSVSTDCCNAFSSAFNSSGAVCLCYLLRQPQILGFPLNRIRILSLQSFCSPMKNTTKKIGSVNSICSGSPALPPLHSITVTTPWIRKPSNSGFHIAAPPLVRVPPNSAERPSAPPSLRAQSAERHSAPPSLRAQSIERPSAPPSLGTQSADRPQASTGPSDKPVRDSSGTELVYDSMILVLAGLFVCLIHQ
ncbi:Bifunctional inhibitor/plant lipid transfer protein/seed storage helical domain containing protein, partial [Quillaja saponaria]